ncbi:probable cation-transporting ATPase 13A3 isoform X2 [Cimex lectularius]|nr:probable cation-transporting ATPase 13A3 isoform X2 [Cimex lectularius]XP_014250254.1 probable cation-transporting ATPase 13A3 isoform X2 [Cimex lectularius]
MRQNEDQDKRKTKGYINEGEEEEMVIYGYKEHLPFQVATWIGYFLSLGLLRLVFHWWPHLMLYAKHKQCSLDEATKLLVIDSFEKRFKLMFVKDVRIISISNCRENISTYLYVGDSNEKSMNSLKIHLADGRTKECSDLRFVKVKKISYIWDQSKFKFVRLVGLDNGLKQENFSRFTGLTSNHQKLKQLAYGLNEIIVPISSIPTLVLLEVLNPFYIFQIFSMSVWLSDQYYYYCIAIIIMSVFGISSSVYQTHKNQKHLNETIHSTDVVTVKRGESGYEEIETSSLVPGDIIVIPPQGCTVHCDAILLNGQCIVNESMLTGESVPVTKSYLPKTSKVYTAKEDSQHTLFCGTVVIQTRYYGTEKVHALVTRTGFLTAKGDLVRSILYPPPADFKFDQDSFKFIWLLAFIGILGFAYTIYIKTSDNLELVEIVIKSLDLFTIVIPVALPAAMTVGKIYALKRLKSKKISCINSRVINVSGSVNCVCFDKTGTLTEDGLDMWGVIAVNEKYFDTPCSRPGETTNKHLLHGMTTCHSVAMVNGALCGDPIDTKVFESTNWTIHEPSVPDEKKYDLLAPTVVRPPATEVDCSTETEIGILHQFAFASDLQRMSVVTRQLGSKDLILYCKGSPEMIISLSNPETVPSDFMPKLREYTEQGYRVIALGWRKLETVSYHKLDRLRREDVERDLNLVGLIILENRVKPETIPTIEVLKQAKIKIIMITGDNIQTAESVARESGIVSQFDTILELSVGSNESKQPEIFYTKVTKAQGLTSDMYQRFTKEVLDHGNYKIAMTGKVWEAIRGSREEFFPNILYKSVVFARMASEQKQQVIVELQQTGYYVAMCGDGANDCGALRAAHVGVSLSEAEASVASPFTSRVQNISCVEVVIKEGRAALTTSFGVFKFMIIYSVIEFFSTILLYNIGTNLTDFQFLYIDMALVLNFASLFGRCKAYHGPLVAQTPMPSMLHILQILSLIFQAVIIVSIQLISSYVVRQYSWFEPFQYKGYKEYRSYENFAVFSVSQFQYITAAFVFSQGPPFREPIYTNKIFFASILTMILVCVYVTLYPSEWIVDVLEFRYPPEPNFPIMVILFGLVHFLVSMFFEDFFINWFLFKKLRWGVKCNKPLK